ncbi:cytochrome ubiquinol oxidase subunit I [Nocardiopsis changdeensis]|uniref:Cytochrome ubiquinol oxidase subunit I n=1 Tax=Nocardiopsis changdeensis TaxID=2831969 RepID=A0ABX8BUF9_9ACTN|nr:MULTISPECIES: cytochrome ubiquinol oxidase subunit I [Nocardiopsis]QUX24008.1 cytochrome ubiquinol oxidase subunit I [Nocardiopsis changdeensis]QYX34404.1 cytochrome ubiquinol oxidase subunit I [Nocardiopsis sp. MT53]
MFDDPLLLARLQFAFTAATHFMFVALTLGLAPYILTAQLRATLSGDRERMSAVRFWGGLYLVNYGMGVLSGLVMELQLALNWSGLQEMYGYSFGAPLALETMTAFFIESTFLGLWIFGWDRMGRWAHLGCFAVVTATAYLSAWWVLVSNGFLRNPVGFEMVDGVAHLTDPVALMTNPAATMAFGHIVTGALLVGAAVIIATSAYHLRRGNDPQRMFSRGIGYGALVMVLLPIPVAGFGGVQFGLFGQDPPTSGQTYSAAEIEAIEAAGSGVHAGVGTAAEVFMMGMWGLMFLLGPVLLLGWVIARVSKSARRLRGALYPLAVLPFLPYLASVGGWVFRETNRQPWTVVHHLTTADAVTPMSPAAAATSFGLFTLAFALLAGTTWWLLVRFARRGPEGGPLAERRDDGAAPAESSTPVPTF